MELVGSNTIKIFNPRKFIIWMIIVSSCMAFAGLTSAFIVMQSQGNKVFIPFQLPSVYLISTFIVLISSVSLQMAYNRAQQNLINESKVLVLITFLLGSAFAYLQVKGFYVLYDQNISLLGTQSPWNASLTFILIILHLFHLMLAMFVLILLLIKSFSKSMFDRNIITFHNCVVFWHFLGILWVFLYTFLYISLKI
jgi:cytochrome c oxidase subunit III